MPRYRLRVSTICLACITLIVSAARLPAADADASNAPDEYKKIKEVWDGKIKEVAELQTKLAAAPPPINPRCLSNTTS